MTTKRKSLFFFLPSFLTFHVCFISLFRYSRHRRIHEPEIIEKSTVKEEVEDDLVEDEAELEPIPSAPTSSNLGRRRRESSEEGEEDDLSDDVKFF